MDVTTFLYAGVIGAVLSGATFGGCRWWYGKRMSEMLARIEKLEAARQNSTQLVQQARKQVETLQQEMAALRKDKERNDSQSQRKREVMEATLQREEERQSAGQRPSAKEVSNGFAPTQVNPAAAMPVNGFADTLPFTMEAPPRRS